MIKILVSKLTPEGINVSGEEPFEFLGLENDDNICSVGPIYYELMMQLVNNGILVTGQLDVALTCRCAKCMEENELHIENNAICHFYEKPNKNEIDLTDDIREDILIALPQRFLCSNSCKGLCFRCGENLNTRRCSCGEANRQGDVWQKLNQLEFKDQYFYKD